MYKTHINTCTFLLHVLLLFEKHDFPDTQVITQTKRVSGRRAEPGVKRALNHLPHLTPPPSPATFNHPLKANTSQYKC